MKSQKEDKMTDTRLDTWLKIVLGIFGLLLFGLFIGFLLKDPSMLEFTDTGLTNTCFGFEYLGDPIPMFGDFPIRV